MAGNGGCAGGVVRGFVQASGSADKDGSCIWTSTAVAFPATVVDPIVPATTETDR